MSKDLFDNGNVDDDELFDLFQHGTAPERDESFVERVVADFKQIRLITNLTRLIKLGILITVTIWLLMVGEFFLPMLSPLIEIAWNLINDTVIQIGIGLVCVVFMRRLQPLR